MNTNKRLYINYNIIWDFMEYIDTIEDDSQIIINLYINFNNYKYINIFDISQNSIIDLYYNKSYKYIITEKYSIANEHYKFYQRNNGHINVYYHNCIIKSNKYLNRMRNILIKIIFMHKLLNKIYYKNYVYLEKYTHAIHNIKKLNCLRLYKLNVFLYIAA